MKLFQSKLRVAASVVAICAASATAHAQIYEAGDLVLFFQAPGSDSSTLMVSLGDVQTAFRDATPGTLTNIRNIDSALDTAFGTSWQDFTALYMGAAANIGTSGSTTVNGDVRTSVYVTKSRNSVTSLETSASSVGLAGTSAATVASAINGQNGRLVGDADGSLEEDASASGVDNQNPFTNVSLGIQGTAFSGFPGGVQTRFASGNLGNYSSVTGVEAALDLFRINRTVATNATNAGEYLGTILLANNGDVSFYAVPEPSVIGLLTLTGIAGAVALRRRLKTKQS